METAPSPSPTSVSIPPPPPSPPPVSPVAPPVQPAPRMVMRASRDSNSAFLFMNLLLLACVEGFRTRYADILTSNYSEKPEMSKWGIAEMHGRREMGYTIRHNQEKSFRKV